MPAGHTDRLPPENACPIVSAARERRRNYYGASSAGAADRSTARCSCHTDLVPTLYEHAGGEQALHRLEEVFYEKALADPVLKELFTTRVPTHVEHLTWFTAESFGGPERFTSGLGFQYIIEVHRGLKITDEQRERFVAAYLAALDEAGLPDDAPFRQAVREHVEFGADVAQQNSWASSDRELHPIRAVPRWSWPEHANADDANADAR